MKNFVAFDLETTGLSENDEIIEIGLAKVNDGKIIEKFSTLVKPSKRLTKDIVELTGISQRMLDEAPIISDVIDKTKEFIGNDIIVGHNVSFDLSFIGKFIILKNDYLDTLKLTKIFYPFSHTHSLGHIAKYLGIKTDVEHRALDDAITTAMIILKMNEDLKKLGFKTLFDIQNTLPDCPERNYIKELLKDVGNEIKYNYEIPINYIFIDKEVNDFLLLDDIQKEIFENISENNFNIIELVNVNNLKDIVVLPILKFVKNNKEKFCIVKTESENINEFFSLIIRFADEQNSGIKAVFKNNKESYLCLKKFYGINKSESNTIEPFTMASLIFWLSKTKTGNLNEIKNIIKDDEIKLNIDETCRGVECEFYDKCFFFEIANKEKDADIIITNYISFFRNYIEYKNVLFLDAEEIEEKATQGFSLIIEFKEIDYILKNIFENMPELKNILQDDYNILRENFNMMGKEILDNNEKFRNGIIFSEYKDRFISISEIISTMNNKINDNKYTNSLRRFLDRLNEIFLRDNDYVLKINFSKTDELLSGQYIFYPVEVWKKTYEKILKIDRGVFISGGITTGCNFDFFKMISGLDKIKKEIKTNSFNFSKEDSRRFKIYATTFLPPYNSNDFNKDIVLVLKEVFKGFKKSYVMFTSYTNAEKVFELVNDKEGSNFYKHAKYKNLNSILKNNDEYIVLGTLHLFDKVNEKKFDILVIPKIPFPNMMDEIIKRRIEALSRYGFDGFKDYLLPIAILKIKKSFLKMLKISFDRCAVILLDRRMFDKDYSSIITDSLPVETEKVESKEELKEKLIDFFNG